MLICSHHIGDFTALRARHFTTHAFFTTRCGRTSREVPGDWRAAGRGRVAEGPSPPGFHFPRRSEGETKVTLPAQCAWESFYLYPSGSLQRLSFLLPNR